MILIDAHGPDHGLSVEVDITYSHQVTIKQWCELCEPDHDGNLLPYIQEATVSLADLLDKSAPHYKSANRGARSMHGRIVHLALAWLGYWGGSEDILDEGARPCDHFGMNYSGIGARRSEPWPDHMTCATCNGKPE